MFQFQMVRLKYALQQQIIETEYVSIPNGSIKMAVTVATMVAACVFQFQMVRLKCSREFDEEMQKAVSIPNGSIKILMRGEPIAAVAVFQFQMVRLKSRPQPLTTAIFKKFQFQMVRLKSRRSLCSAFACRSFNSKWFD